MKYKQNTKTFRNTSNNLGQKKNNKATSVRETTSQNSHLSKIETITVKILAF